MRSASFRELDIDRLKIFPRPPTEVSKGDPAFPIQRHERRELRPMSELLRDSLTVSFSRNYHLELTTSELACHLSLVERDMPTGAVVLP